MAARNGDAFPTGQPEPTGDSGEIDDILTTTGGEAAGSDRQAVYESALREIIDGVKENDKLPIILPKFDTEPAESVTPCIDGRVTDFGQNVPIALEVKGEGDDYTPEQIIMNSLEINDPENNLLTKYNKSLYPDSTDGLAVGDVPADSGMQLEQGAYSPEEPITGWPEHAPSTFNKLYGYGSPSYGQSLLEELTRGSDIVGAQEYRYKEYPESWRVSDSDHDPYVAEPPIGTAMGQIGPVVTHGEIILDKGYDKSLDNPDPKFVKKISSEEAAALSEAARAEQEAEARRQVANRRLTDEILAQAIKDPYYNYSLKPLLDGDEVPTDVFGLGPVTIAGLRALRDFEYNRGLLGVTEDILAQGQSDGGVADSSVNDGGETAPETK